MQLGRVIQWTEGRSYQVLGSNTIRKLVTQLDDEQSPCRPKIRAAMSPTNGIKIEFISYATIVTLCVIYKLYISLEAKILDLKDKLATLALAK